METSEKLLLTRREFTEATSISLRLLDYLVKRGEVRVRRVGRKVLIPYSEAVRFARSDHAGRGKPALEAK